jgi:hypothetical protein
VLDRLHHAIRTATAGLTRRIRAIKLEQVLWLLLAAVFLLYVLTLLLEPSSAGKGGR